MNINQITVPVLDVEKAIHFYETLGLTLIVKSLPDYARFVAKDGSTSFSLHRVSKLSEGEGVWIYFETDNVDDRAIELKNKGIVFEALPQDQPWLWREVRLKDLDNNQLIIYHAGENRLNPPWKIK